MKKSLTIFVLTLFTFSLLLAEITTQNTNPGSVVDLAKYQTRELLLDQISDPATEGGITAQDFEDGYDTYDAEGADEFAVPADGWTINQVMVLGSYSAAGPCDLANVRFYADDGGMPGTLVHEHLAVAANPDVDGNLDITIPDSYLGEGTYWVSVQGKQDFGTAGQWYWGKQEAPTIGEMFYWRNPGDGFASGNIDWVPATTQWPEYEDLNLAFALYGTIGGGGGPGVFPLVEDFEGGALPEGWTMTTLSAVGWFISQDGSSAYWTVPAGDGYYACSNDDEANDDGSMDYLISPALDFSDRVTAELTFDSFYGGNYGQLATVEVSTDGTTFDVVYDVEIGDDWNEQVVDLSAYAGSPEVWIAFHSDDVGAWASGWAIDNVTVDEATMQTGTFNLHLVDSYGDGWNGGIISILVNDVVVLDAVTIADGSEADFVFDVATGDVVFCDYTEGSWSYENEYYVYNNIGVLVASSGMEGEVPEDITFTAEVMDALYGSLAGMVTTVERTPIEGAEVTIGAQTGITGADGAYLIEDVFIGTYDVTCFAEGYFPAFASEVLIEEDLVTTLDFALDVIIGDVIEDPYYVEWAGTSYYHAGNSSYFNDDYDTGSTDIQPDVVYEFTIDFDTMVDVSLLGSEFDTKLGIYEYGVVPGVDNYLYFNDDYSGREVSTSLEKKEDRNRVLQSALYDMELTAGTYVVVVDGYGTYSDNFGNYMIDIFFDPVSIYDIQYTEIPGDDNDYPSLMIGETVLVTGVVTATDGESKFWLQDAEGPWNGVYLYSYDLDPIPAVGDEITVTCEVDEYYGLTELLDVTEYSLNSSGNGLLGPAVVATGSVDESYESVYSQFLVATCTAVANEYGEALVNDGTGDAKTDDTLYLFEPVLDGIYNVTGVVTYSFSEFKLLPRSAGDIEDITDELTWPPVDLTGVIVENNILLDWVAPTQYGWNSYYPGPQYLNWSTPERATLYDMADFGFSYPIELSAIEHGFYHHGSYPWGDDVTFTCKIYDTDGVTLLHETEALTALDQWAMTEIPIPTMTMTDNFWVAIVPVNATNGYPSSLNNDVVGNGLGESHGYVGEPGAWEPYYEWNTSIYIMGDGVPARIGGTSFDSHSGHNTRVKNFDDYALIDKIPQTFNQPSRALLGFNIFRDDVMLNDELITSSSYDDLDLAEGTYSYYVTAVWHMGESGPSNEVVLTLAFGDLEGTITDSETDDPIEGAVVSAGSYGATTDADGYYLIEGMLIGNYDVSASATLYLPADPVNVEITDGGVTVVDFALEPEGGDIFFLDDFEAGGGNWAFDAESTWGITDEDSHSPTHSMHESPGGNYGANLNISSTLAVPWDLSGVLDATLSYWYKCDIETAFDYMYLEITSDGETWLNLMTYDIQDMEEYVQETIAMGGFVGAGYEAVQIRFRFESDGGFEINGMYIDDLLVTTSMDDLAAPFIVHAAPEFYEGTADDYVFTADVVDVSGIASADVVFTLDGADETALPYTSADGSTYTFTIPAQDAGVQVDYAIVAVDASENSNEGEMGGYVYIAGTPFIYDNGFVDFYTTVAEGTGAAVKIVNPPGFQLNLAYALIRNYTDQSGQDNDDFEFHVWADNGGVPGDDLITPFVISPEASYDNTSAMTRVDLRDYAADLNNIVGDFYVGFLANTGGEYGIVHCTITQPGDFANSFLFDGAGWTFWDGTDLHFRAVAELIPTSIGTVEGFVTRSDTDDPLEGALVSIGSATGLTEADGSYSIIADPGTQDVTCTLDGYNEFSGSVDVVENDTVTLDIQLSPAFWAPANLAATYNPPNPNVVLQWDEPVPPAGEIVELIYDNEVSTGAYSYTGYTMATQMSPEEACQILELKIHTSAGSEFNAEVWGWDTAPTEDLLYQELVTTVATDDWNIIDVSAEGLMVDGDFLVGFGSIAADTYMSYDGDLDNGRSWDHADAGGWGTWGEAYLLRAVVMYGDGRIAEIAPITIEPVVPMNRAERSGSRISIDVEDHFVGSTRELTGYNVYRDDEVIGSPTSTFFLDAAVPGGLHEYYVTAVYSDPTGESGPSNVIVVEVEEDDADDPVIPVVTELTGNYPNPFNPSTTISFAISEAGQVNVEIYNIRGEKVKTLIDGFMEANFYTEEWDGSDDNLNSVSSGVYFYKMKAGRYTSTKKMILMK
jgi:carboxypeptidase family protein/type IX secretion system substrate protein